MKNLLHRASAFLFAPTAATGFGMMRFAWGAICLVYFLFQWVDVPLFYGDHGVLPPELEQFMVRGEYRFTILTWVTNDNAVFALYVLMLTTFFFACVGLWPRLSTVLSTVLLFSFHERDAFVLGGGDTVLRHIGFLLCIAPELRAFSLTRLVDQWHQFKKEKTLLPPLQMPIWPMRLMLWQLIVLYGTSLWFKSLGTMWIRGTAVAAALHHPYFSHLSKSAADTFAPFTTTIDYGVLLFHFCWVLLLIPRWATSWLPKRIPRFPLKRMLILAGIFFHGGIFVMMDAGCFSLAVMTAYLGLLTGEDLDAIRAFFNRGFDRRTKRTKLKRIAVLYDGKCGFCMRSIFVLEILDRLDRLQFVNFWNRIERNDVAADIKEADLDRAMHVRYPSGKTLTGFDGFRSLAWNIPLLWPAAPFLYLPGVTPLGRQIYAWVALRRKKCSHDNCQI